MTRSPIYVVLPDGRAVHVVADNEHTACGQPVPTGTGWVAEPEKVCAKCQKAQDGDEA